MTFQQHCFCAIRKNGGTGSIALLTRLIGADRERVTSALVRLAKRGWLRRLGGGAYTIARNGEPEDLRGLAEASQANLSAEGRARGALHLRAKRARVPHVPVPKPKTALEQAWGFMPTLSFPALRDDG